MVPGTKRGVSFDWVDPITIVFLFVFEGFIWTTWEDSSWVYSLYTGSGGGIL